MQLYFSWDCVSNWQKVQEVCIQCYGTQFQTVNHRHRVENMEELDSEERHVTNKSVDKEVSKTLCSWITGSERCNFS